MFMLHQLGYSLAPSMGELTPGQAYYLLNAAGHHQKIQQTHMQNTFGGVNHGKCY